MATSPVLTLDLTIVPTGVQGPAQITAITSNVDNHIQVPLPNTLITTPDPWNYYFLSVAQQAINIVQTTTPTGSLLFGGVGPATGMTGMPIPVGVFPTPVRLTPGSYLHFVTTATGATGMMGIARARPGS